MAIFLCHGFTCCKMIQQLRSGTGTHKVPASDNKAIAPHFDGALTARVRQCHRTSEDPLASGVFCGFQALQPAPPPSISLHWESASEELVIRTPNLQPLIFQPLYHASPPAVSPTLSALTQPPGPAPAPPSTPCPFSYLHLSLSLSLSLSLCLSLTLSLSLSLSHSLSLSLSLFFFRRFSFLSFPFLLRSPFLPSPLPLSPSWSL